MFFKSVHFYEQTWKTATFYTYLKVVLNGVHSELVCLANLCSVVDVFHWNDADDDNDKDDDNIDFLSPYILLSVSSGQSRWNIPYLEKNPYQCEI